MYIYIIERCLWLLSFDVKLLHNFGFSHPNDIHFSSCY